MQYLFYIIINVYCIYFSYAFPLICNNPMNRNIITKLYDSINNPISNMIQEIPVSKTPSHFYSQKSFNDLKLNKYSKLVIDALQLTKPSKIQALTFNEIVSGKSCAIADQTGSGKTLAYLLPTIQRMYDFMNNNSISSTSLDDNIEDISPSIVIMTPTNELANQVSKVVKSISSILRFRSACLTSTSDMTEEIRKLKIGCDVVVCTPGRIFSLLKNGILNLKNTKSIILDEADVLFLDETFPLQGIGSYCPQDAQFLFVTATLPDSILKQITKEFPETTILKGPGLHRIPPTIEEILVDCSVKEQRTNANRYQTQDKQSRNRYSEAVFENKRLALLNALQINANVERTLIFCNTIEQCRNVENAIMRSDRHGNIRNVYSYHSAIDNDVRQGNLQAFTKRLLPLPVVLICTDRASRGIDFDQFNVSSL